MADPINLESARRVTITPTNAPGPQGPGAPNLMIQYSVDGETNWHETPTIDDAYFRISTDGGVTWDNPVYDRAKLAEAARDKAEQWANEAEDVQVEAGEYSAYHWKQKAQDIANLNNVALTGTPTAPTAPVGTSTTQIATTEFVNVVLDTNIYARNSLPSIKGTSVAADRYTWQSPAGGLVVGINGTVYALTTQTEIDLSNAANWDTATPDYTVASARAGKDFYVYACEPASGNTPDIVLSASSTYPSGYTADNSRKISGFHCVCANIGTITGHPLSGFVAGDILPLSVWDLRHRPKTASPEGMVWSEAANIWVDIYLQSGTGATTASAYGATITDTRTWMDHVDDLSDVNKRLLDDGEFQKIAAGGNEETNIAGSADPGTTGGHNDTAGRRMISAIGCEDCAGVMWQWLSDQSFRSDYVSGWGWYDLPGAKGSLYNQDGVNGRADVKLRAGGDWDGGAGCGSRCRHASSYRWHTPSDCGARGAAEPV